MNFREITCYKSWVCLSSLTTKYITSITKKGNHFQGERSSWLLSSCLLSPPAFILLPGFAFLGAEEGVCGEPLFWLFKEFLNSTPLASCCSCNANRPSILSFLFAIQTCVLCFCHIYFLSFSGLTGG